MHLQISQDVFSISEVFSECRALIFKKRLTFYFAYDIILHSISEFLGLYGGFTLMDDGDGDTCQYTVIIT